jgi:hypothetical protein
MAFSRLLVKLHVSKYELFATHLSKERKYSISLQYEPFMEGAFIT